MKTLRSFTAVIVVLALGASSLTAAPPNPYDTFAKVLMPFVNALAKNSRAQEKAFTAILELEAATGIPEDVKDARLEVAFQSPNKLKIIGPLFGEKVTVCRKGQKLWAAPGQKIEAILAAASESKTLPPADPTFKLAPFSLPFPEKQLVFLPALFRVQAAGEEAIDGESCQVIDVQLMPELERSLKDAKGWTARIWAKPNGRPARIQVNGPEVSLTVKITQLTFSEQLSKDTWAPSKGEEATDVPPARYDQLVRALLQR